VSGATATNTAPSVNNANGATVLGGNVGLGFGFMGKYMLNGNTAARVRFNATTISETRREYVAANSLITNPLEPVFAEDEYTRMANNYSVALGLEKRKGSTRLQGIYGAEVFLGVFNESREFTYGNAMSADFTSPSSFNFVGNINNLGGVISSRTLEQNFGTQFFMGARGYVGVEYFVAPKISIGAEIGYSLGLLTNGEASRVDETFDPVALAPTKVTTKQKRNQNLSSFGWGLDNFNSNLNMFFYF
jgi:hypothetical protein